MKTQYSKEDLIHNLPDYISNRLEDNDLILEIENEIKINPEFKNEYEEIISTFDFLNSTELEAPHENYFNNLSVKINSRTENENSKISLWEKISRKWKLLIPAVSSAAIVLIMLNYFNDPAEQNISDKIKFNENNDSISENKISNTKPADGLQIRDENKSNTERSTVNDLKQTNLAAKKNKANRNNVGNLNISVPANDADSKSIETTEDLFANNSEISENTITDSEEDILIINDTEEDSFDDELMELTPEEQKEILENLNKSKI